MKPYPSSHAEIKKQIVILGVRIDDLSMDETIDEIDRMIEDGGFHHIATANVDFLTKASEDPELLSILHSCDLVLADGMPLVWSSRLMGVPLKERVTGADLLPRLLHLSAAKRRKIFLLGASEDRSKSAARRIRKDFPDAVICGRLSPPLAPLASMDSDAILGEIHACRPDILLVAFGNPKQEKWIAMHREQIQVPVCIGVGASIDFLSGEQARAPVWMQDSGLEWLFRLASEPRRLALRYLDNAIFLLRHLSMQLLANSLRPHGSAQGSFAFEWEEGTLTATVVGGFTGAVVERFIAELRSHKIQSSLVLDLSAVTFITADAAGAIARMAHQRARLGREVWIVGESPVLQKALRATFPTGKPFRTASTLEDALVSISKEQPGFTAIPAQL